MTRPKNTSFGEAKLEYKQKYNNGVIYELWHSGIDNFHHIHLPAGMLITFRYEDCEGSVTIKEIEK